jgi:hypothetical protein
MGHQHRAGWCGTAGGQRNSEGRRRSLEVYAVSAYILQLNGIIGDSDPLNAQTLPGVHMPNRDGFVPFSQ